jgi:hypothetical protein
MTKYSRRSKPRRERAQVRKIAPPWAAGVYVFPAGCGPTQVEELFKVQVHCPPFDLLRSP